MTPFENRKLDRSKPVLVYRNLHRGGYSIMQNRLIVAHADDVWLTDVTFKVSEYGRQRVLREGVKNVHAFVQGHVIEQPTTNVDLARGLPTRYNPKRAPDFEVLLTTDGQEQWRPLAGASIVHLSTQCVELWGAMLKVGSTDLESSSPHHAARHVVPEQHKPEVW